MLVVPSLAWKSWFMLLKYPVLVLGTITEELASKIRERS